MSHLKKPDNTFRRVGLTGNAEKAEFAALVRRAARLVRDSGRTVCCDLETARCASLRGTTCPDTAALARAVDLLLVFGGDGTVLRVAREAAGCATALLGINIGGLGFLTAVSSAGLGEELKHVWHGDFTLEPRALIEATGVCRGQPVRLDALNDFVISRGRAARLIELEVTVDEESLTRYRCDGLIVSSPTGSTAYSLAAGGALVCPTADVFALTPICPHTLSNRPVIVRLDSIIRVKVIKPNPETILCADGQVMHELAGGDVVTIRRSRKTVRLMHLPGTSFFETLRHKLHWRGASV